MPFATGSGRPASSATPIPILAPQARKHTHTRNTSAPIYLPSTPLPRPAGPAKSPRGPGLRVITSFPLPPPRRPKLGAQTQSLDQGIAIRQPVPVRHYAPPLLNTAPLPATRRDHAASLPRRAVYRKPVPALQVDVDMEHDHAQVVPPTRPCPPIKSSLEKRMRREAVIISDGMYTSYQPDRLDWGTRDTSQNDGAISAPSPTRIIPSTSRPSGRGHKRTISDKFKSLFSPSPPRPPHIQLSTSSPAPSAALVLPEEDLERIPMNDESDIPTYSATYPQPDDPFYLAVPHTPALTEAAGQPGRPYRSPGTASFVVSREEDIWGVSAQGGEADENAARRNTFGVIEWPKTAMASLGTEVRSVAGSEGFSPGSRARGSSDGTCEADDEMSPEMDPAGEVVLAYLVGGDGGVTA